MTVILSKKRMTPVIRQCKGKRVVIFGAGPVGAQLALILHAQGCRLAGILDDYASPGSSMNNLTIQPASRLEALKPDVVVLATLKARRRMTQRLQNLGFTGQIVTLPGDDSDPYFNKNLPDREDLRRFQNLHAKQPAVIIGNGPSLLKTDPRRLKEKITFACNSIFLLENFTPNYYCVEDLLVAEDRASVINNLPWIKFFPQDCKQWLSSGHFFNGHRVPEITKFSTDFAEGIQINATVTYTMLQLAFHMGCDPVYLIGVDHSYTVSKAQSDRDRNILTSKTDDPNHFHPDYFGRGLRWHDPRVDRMEIAYRLAKAAFTRHDRKIFNATGGGKLEIFDRIDFEKIRVTSSRFTN